MVAGDVVPGAVVPSTSNDGASGRPADSSSGITPTAPVATFAHLVDVALDQPATAAPAPGQYEYTRSQEAYADCNAGAVPYCYLLPEERQIWVGTDGSGRLLESFGTPVFETPAARAAWVQDGSPPLGVPTSDTTFGPGGLSLGPSDLASLPTNPTALAAELSARKIEGGPPGPAEDFVQIGDMLRETDASPALRAALFEVAEGIPGVVVLGTVPDHSGRRGIGVGRVGDDGVEQEYVFDSTTSAFLGEEMVATRPDASTGGAPAGTVLGRAVYESHGIVGSLVAEHRRARRHRRLRSHAPPSADRRPAHPQRRRRSPQPSRRARPWNVSPDPVPR